MPLEITSEDGGKRSVWQAMVRGFSGRCPHCGQGRLFKGYLKPVAACSVCGEDFTHQRSDDFAPYVTMVAVGHVIVPLILVVQINTALSELTLLSLFLPATAIIAAALLRPVKGAIIGLQWALRMHGFDGHGNADVPEAILAYPAAVARQPLPKTGLVTK